MAEIQSPAYEPQTRYRCSWCDRLHTFPDLLFDRGKKEAIKHTCDCGQQKIVLYGMIIREGERQ